MDAATLNARHPGFTRFETPSVELFREAFQKPAPYKMWMYFQVGGKPFELAVVIESITQDVEAEAQFYNDLFTRKQKQAIALESAKHN
jgi:hypothetical protein